MDLHILFIQRKEEYPEQFAPEALVVWDEYCVEENPEGFEAACAEAIKSVGDDLLAHKVVRFRVSQPKIRELLLETPVIEAKLLG